MITYIVFIVSLVILLCILSEKLSYSTGIPALILFMFVGMMFGDEGFMKIAYDNFESAQMACSIALIFIMFNGGFDTNWHEARKTVKQAVSLSTIGVVVTALIATLCLHYMLSYSWPESFLISAVLASTDAASVFAIMKRNNLDLKDGTSSILEVESGSNDPMAYLLTITAIGFMTNSSSGNLFLTVFLQLSVGFLCGMVFARLSRLVLSMKNVIGDGLNAIFILSVVMLCYAICDNLHGNAYLSVYILGLYLGNSRINDKKSMAAFFNELTSLLQIMMFFLIGLLSSPFMTLQALPKAFMIVVILTFIARPLMTLIILLPQKCSFKQCLLISWAGLRGASSIVFAITAVSMIKDLPMDLFHIVFMVSLFSIAVQGALLPTVARKLDMIDENPDVYRTFNAYRDTIDFHFTRMHVGEKHPWVNRHIRDIEVPLGAQVVMIRRSDQTLSGRGKTVIEAGDDLIMNVPPYYPSRRERVQEILVNERHQDWYDKTLAEIGMKDNELVVMVIRDDDKFVPDGKTIIHKGDVLLVFQGEENS